MSTPKKYVPVICTEIRNNGKPCGGHFKSDLSGNFYCMECGIQYQDAFGHAAEESSESMYDEMDKEEATDGLGSLYQEEQQLGGRQDVAINAIERRLIRNLDAFHKSISMPSADESSAKAKLHEKAETHRRIKKELSKVKSIFVYNGKENKKKKGHRIASILAWAKELGPVSSAVLRQTLADHNTPITYTEFDRILDQLVEEGRITREKQANKTGNTNTRQPYIITFLH